jgi:hypothetical protein
MPVALASAVAMKEAAVSRETVRRIDTLRWSDGTVVPEPRGISETPAKAMSQSDSRYDGCVVFGASLGTRCSLLSMGRAMNPIEYARFALVIERPLEREADLLQYPQRS